MEVCLEAFPDIALLEKSVVKPAFMCCRSKLTGALEGCLATWVLAEVMH